MIGVKVTVVPTVRTRHGLGGWIEMIARLGKAKRLGGPGGIWIVSIMTRPPAVSMVVRVHPPGQAATKAPAGIVNGTPTTKVLGVIGSRCTLTTFATLTVTVTKPSGVWT